jgi:hypothetical protein
MKKTALWRLNKATDEGTNFFLERLSNKNSNLAQKRACFVGHCYSVKDQKKDLSDTILRRLPRQNTRCKPLIYGI